MNVATLALIISSLPIAAARPQDAAAPSTPIESTIAMPSGRKLALAGAWTETKTLGGEHAIVFTRWMHDHRELVSIDAGVSEPRTIARIGQRHGLLDNGIAWAPDGSACFLWLDTNQQICRVDTRTREIKSLTSFDARDGIVFDSAPDARPGGIVLMNDLLVFVVRDEPDAAPPANATRAKRNGESWLVALDPDDRSMVELSKAKWPSLARDSWEISATRKTLYRTTLDRVLPGGPDAGPFGEESRILATSLDGILLWEMPFVRPGALLLSPNEKWLLVERLEHRYAVGDTLTLVNPEDHSVRAVPAEGHGCAWSPDSKRFAYLWRWDLCTFDVETGSVTTIATVRDAKTTGPLLWKRLVWSPDGRMLLANIGEAKSARQVFDLEARTVLFLDCGFEDGNVGFAPMAKPFAGD